MTQASQLSFYMLTKISNLKLLFSVHIIIIMLFFKFKVENNFLAFLLNLLFLYLQITSMLDKKHKIQMGR